MRSLYSIIQYVPLILYNAHLIQMEELLDERGCVPLCIQESQLPHKVADLLVVPDDHPAQGGRVHDLLHVLVDVWRVDELDAARDAVHRGVEVEAIEAGLRDTAQLRGHSLQRVTLQRTVHVT